MDWFRSRHGAPADTKLSLVAIKSGQHRAFVTAVWWEVLDHASRIVTQGHTRGDLSTVDAEIIAHQQGITPEQVQAILDAMCDRGMIVDGRVANWDKHQVKREDSQAAERKRDQRERDRKKVTPQANVSRNVTERHAPDADVPPREEESREDKKEGDDTAVSSKRGKRLLDELGGSTALPPDYLMEATALGWKLEDTQAVWSEFVDYWRGVLGQKGVKLDWPATWRNALKNIFANKKGKAHANSRSVLGRTDRQTRRSGFAEQDYSAGTEGFVLV